MLAYIITANKIYTHGSEATTKDEAKLTGVISRKTLSKN